MTIPPLVLQRGTTNGVFNPRAASSTTGWVPSANRTLDRTTSLPAGGPAGISTGFVATATANLASGTWSAGITSASATAAIPHVASIWVYIPASWTGGTVGLSITNFTGASGATSGAADMAIRDAWQRPWFVFTPDAADLSGNFQARVVGTWASGEYIIFTACQLEPGSTPSAYTDSSRAARRTSGFLVPGSPPRPLHIGKD